MNFSGKRVLVTGAAQGLGKTIVEKFYENGANVVALDLNVQGLEKLKHELPKVTTVAVDITNWEAVRIEMEKLEDLHILINNAGVMKFSTVLEMPEEHIDFHFAVNFKAAINVSQLFAKQVAAKGIKNANIVNISSIGDEKVMKGYLMYHCTKAAMTMLTKGCALEFAPLGIRVNAVRPAVMPTQMFHNFMAQVPGDADELMKKVLERNPIPRMLQTTDTAESVLFLASSSASMITGTTVTIDGGRCIV